MFTGSQAKIIAKSIKIVSASGIQNLTIKNIAKAMEVSEPAIYRHFESKSEILHSMLSFLEEKLKLNIPSEGDMLNPLLKIKYLFMNTIDVMIENPAMSAIIFSEEIFQNDEALAKKVFSIMQKKHAVIMKVLNEGIKKKVIRDDIPIENLTTVLLGSLRLMVVKWRFDNQKFDLKKEVKTLWTSLEKMLVKNNTKKEEI